MSSSVRRKMNEMSKSAKRARYPPEAVVVVEPEVINETPKPVEKESIFKKATKAKRKVFKKI